MTSTFDEIVANFDGETTESFVVQDAEVIDDLPAGTRFKWGPSGLTWIICDETPLTPGIGAVSRETAKNVLAVTGVMHILNPEFLGEFAPLPETEPGFEELVGDLARKVFDAIGAERMTEALEALLPDPWFPQVEDRVRVVFGHGWNGPGTVLHFDQVSGIALVRVDHRGLMGGFELHEIEPLVVKVGDQVEVVETRYLGSTRQVGATGKVVSEVLPGENERGDFRVLIDHVNDWGDGGVGWGFYARELRVIG